MSRSPGRWGRDRCSMRAVLAIIALGLALLIAPAAANAQWFSPWSIAEDGTPAIGARQLRQYAEILGLSADQKAAADELLAGYEREHRDLSKRMQEVSKAISEEFDNDDEIDVWREVYPKVLKNYMKKTDQLSKTFMEDLKTLLEPAQLSRWPQIERLHRRQSTLRLGSRAGERTDLIDIVDGLRLDPAAAQSVAPVLEQYALDLDRELAARNKFIEDRLEQFFEVWMNWDEEKMKSLFGEMNGYSQKIVNVNRSYSRQVLAALPPDRQAEFDHQVKLSTFPRVYKKTYAMRVLDAAEKLPDLDESQREAIKGIRESFTRDSAVINDKWAAALAEQESKQQEQFPWAFWGGQEDPAIAEARNQRKELEKKTVESIKALLNEEQKNKLPDRKWRPEFDLDAPLQDR